MLFNDEKMQAIIENDILRAIESFNTILDFFYSDNLNDEEKISNTQLELRRYLMNRTNFKDYKIPTLKLNEEKTTLIPITSLDESINLAKTHMFNQDIIGDKLIEFYDKLKNN
jgi:hypothetical protein